MTPSDYVILRSSSGTAYGVADLPEAELRQLLEDPERLLGQNIGFAIKISRERLIVVASLRLQERVVRVAYKRYAPRNWWKSLLGLVRRSRALDGWRRAQILVAHNIATAAPIAACQLSGWRRATSYLATQWIEGADNLHAFGWRLASRPMANRLRLAAPIADSLGRLIGRMHAANISHRDLKWANLLVVEAEGDVKTYLIDLDGLRVCRSLRPGRREADMARLAVSLEAHPWVTRTICCRFLRAYAAQFAPGSLAWKPLWRAVAVRSRRAVEQKRRRGQQVL